MICQWLRQTKHRHVETVNHVTVAIAKLSNLQFETFGAVPFTDIRYSVKKKRQLQYLIKKNQSL
jgi:hypothetical protein